MVKNGAVKPRPWNSALRIPETYLNNFRPIHFFYHIPLFLFFCRWNEWRGNTTVLYIEFRFFFCFHPLSKSNNGLHLSTHMHWNMDEKVNQFKWNLFIQCCIIAFAWCSIISNSSKKRTFWENFIVFFHHNVS